MTEPRNAEEAAGINPQAEAFAKAKLRMLEKERAFEAVWAEIGEPFAELWPGLDGTVKSVARDAFKAGAASRQGEVDRLRRAIQAVIPHFLDQPQVVMNHNDYDPYETGPAYLGPQEPVDALRELVRE